MANDLWRTVTGTTNFYGSSTTGSEANMRNELIYTLDGRSPEIAKGQPGLLRKMRRDSDNKLIPCECVDSITREPDKDRFCPICFGDGNKWDETNITFYRVLTASEDSNTMRDTLEAVGLLNVPLVVFYIRYSAAITEEDKVIQIDLDNDGSASSPTQRQAIYRVNSLWDYRSDNGKLEYWKAFAHEETVKYLNAPDFEDME